MSSWFNSLYEWRNSPIGNLNTYKSSTYLTKPSFKLELNQLASLFSLRLWITIGYRLALIYASIDRDETPSVRITLPIDIKNLHHRKKKTSRISPPHRVLVWAASPRVCRICMLTRTLPLNSACTVAIDALDRWVRRRTAVSWHLLQYIEHDRFSRCYYFYMGVEVVIRENFRTEDEPHD